MRQIKDQGHCGSCWAFGAAEAFSDRICVTLGRNVTISENDLLSCCGETTCGGCDGGGFSGSWAYFNTTGAVSEECDPKPTRDVSLSGQRQPAPRRARTARAGPRPRLVVSPQRAR